ncbi:MAG: type IV toxin-antitoxin system AbiEi family antitoxin domain-containing protein [Myxococcaceae bacterium]
MTESNVRPGGKAFEALLREQRGLISREQAAAHGFSDRRIQRRVQNGDWSIIIRGVYLVGRWDLDRKACLQAALLYAGPDAILSHVSAAYAHDTWGFTEPPTSARNHHEWVSEVARSPIDLTVPDECRTSGELIQPLSGKRIALNVRRSRAVKSEATLASSGLRCSSQPRNVVDLVHEMIDRRLSRGHFAMAFEYAIKCGHWFALEQLTGELPPRYSRERATLIDMLERRGPTSPYCESAPEALFDDLLWRAGLISLRQLQITLPNGREVRADFAFLDQNVLVEIEGLGSHNHAQHSSDRERHNGLIDLGFHPLYYPANTVFRRPRAVIDEVTRVLRKRGWKPASQVA